MGGRPFSQFISSRASACMGKFGMAEAKFDFMAISNLIKGANKHHSIYKIKGSKRDNKRVESQWSNEMNKFDFKYLNKSLELEAKIDTFKIS